MTIRGKGIGLIFSIALFIILTISAQAAGTMGLNAFWVNNEADELTMSFDDIATARASFSTTAPRFWYSMTMIDLSTGEVLGGRTEGPIDRTPRDPPGPLTRTRYLAIPTDVPIPDEDGDYRLTIIAWDSAGGSISEDLTLHVLGNHAPVLTATPLSITVGEGDPLTVTLDGTDSDNDALTLVISSSQPSGSALTTVSNEAGHIVKTFSWTPAFTQAGTYDIRFRLSDGSLLDTETVHIVVTDNTAPTITGLTDDDGTILGTTAETNEGDIFIVNIESNDAEGDSLTYEAYKKLCRGGICIRYSLPSEMGLDATNGVLTFSPGFDYVEHPDTDKSDGVYFRAYDGDRYSAERKLTIITNDVDQRPLANSQMVTTPEDTPVDITLTGNDADAEDEEEGFTYTIVTTPLQGMLTVAGEDVQYTPAANYVGIVQFTFTVTDQMGVISSSGTVTITMTAVNDAPTLVIPNPAPLAEDSGITTFNLRTYASDVDDAPSTWVFTVDDQTETGIISCSLAADGFTLLCATQPDQFGSSIVTITIRDPSGASATDWFLITINPVNDAPRLSIPDQSTDEDTPLTIDIGTFITDVDNTAGFTYQVLSQTNTGVVLCSFTAGTSTLTCTPTPDSTGMSTINIEITDPSGGTGLDAFVLRVNAVNDAPRSADDTAPTTDEDTPVTLNVLANDYDVEGNPLTVARFDAVSTQGGTVSCTIAGSCTFTPALNFVGVDTFTYQASDGTATGTAATVTIIVRAVNDAPEGVDDAYSTTEDSPLTITAPGVLINDVNVDAGDVLSVVLPVMSDVTHGTLTLAADGSLRYVPTADYVGSDSFTYMVRDTSDLRDTATVTITITAVNDAPVLADDILVTDEDVAGTMNVLANDGDIDSALAVSSVTQGTSGSVTFTPAGDVTYTPDPDYNGADSFTYTVVDGMFTRTATVSVTVNPANDLPVAVNDAYTTDEDAELVIAARGILANDSDVDGDTLTAVVDSLPTNGGLDLALDGSFVYSPNPDSNGIDSFTYHATDGTDNSNVATVTITVRAVNDVPVADDDTASTEEDTPVSILVLSNDLDADGNALTVRILTSPVQGMAVINGDQTVTYTPNGDYNGLDSFTYVVNDGVVDSAPATVSITVTPVNDAPVAIADSYNTDEDVPLTVDGTTLPLVLANDIDIDGDSLIAVLDSDATNGILTLNADGSFSYTPDMNFNGADSFTYHATDGAANSEIVTVTITVNPINDAPVADDDAVSVNEDQVNVDISLSLLDGDTDVDSGFIFINSVDPALTEGSVSVDLGGNVFYTPSAAAQFLQVGETAIDTFTYTLFDGSLTSSPATVTVTIIGVNDAPVFTSSPLLGAVEDSLYTYTATATDVDGDNLTFAATTRPSWLILTDNGDGTATISGTPTDDDVGPHAVTLTVTDGTMTVEQSFTITVSNVNDAPDAVDDAYTTDEDDTSFTGNVISNDLDVDGGSLTVTSYSQPANGTVSIAADGSFTYSTNGLFDFLAPGETRDEAFTYTISDPSGATDTATVTIVLTGVDDAVIAANDAFATDEDTPLLDLDVLANDSDAEGDPIMVASVDPISHLGAVLTLNADSTINYDPRGQLDDLDAGDVTTDSFEYLAADGGTDSAVVTITVTGVNDAPVAMDITASTDEDTEVFLFLAYSDPDRDDVAESVFVSDPLGGTITTPASCTAGGCTVGLTPLPDSLADITATFIINDGNADSNEATIRVTINPLNDAPVITGQVPLSTDEDTPLTLTLADLLVTDDNAYPDDFALTVLSGTNYDVEGTTITPALNYNGPLEVPVQVNDGALDSDVFTLSVTVNPVNDAPTTADGLVTTTENTPYLFAESDFIYNDVDGGPDELMIIQSVPDQGTFQIDDGTTIKTINVGDMLGRAEWSMLFFTPAADEIGSPYTSFTFVVSDGIMGSISDPATMTINVVPVNDAPDAVDDTAGTEEDTPSTIDVLANDDDPEDDALAVTSVTQGTDGTVTFTPSGVTYAPAADFNGVDSFTYTISDGEFTDTAVVTVTVTGVNDAPVFTSTPITSATEDVAFRYTATATDVDGDGLTFAATELPTWLSFNAATQELSGTPTNADVGTHDITLTVNDGTVTVEQSFTITVSNANDVPVANADSYNTDEDTLLMVGSVSGVLVNDTDADADTLTAVLDTNTANGTLTLNADGSFTYTPDNNFNGVDSFTYHTNDGATDGTGDSLPATVTITVAPRNDAPLADSQAVSVAEDSTNNPVTLTGSDADSNLLTFTVTVNPTHGTLGGAAPNVLYTPTADYNGADLFEFTVNDGTVTSTPATISITVTSSNDAPVAADDSASTDEDTPMTIPVLTNDNDPDADTLTVQSVTTPAAGSATINADNTITYIPDADTSGTDLFTYTISDGNGGTDTATVTVTISSENDAPAFTIALSDVTTPEEVAVTINLNDAVSDAEDADTALTFTVDSSNTAVVTCTITAGQLTCTPITDQIGTSTITVQVTDTDGASTSDSFTLTVTEVSDAPTFTTTNLPDATAGIPYTAVIEATDIEGDAITFTAAGLPSWLTLTDNDDGTATLSGTPRTADVGPEAITLTARDSTGQATTQTFTFTIHANPAPSATNDAYTLTEDTILTVAAPGILANDADPDGEPLTAVLGTRPTHGLLTFNADGSFAYRPFGNFQGTDRFTYAASDRTSQSAPAMVLLTITDVNDAPIITSTPVTTAIVGQLYEYQVTLQDEGSVTFTLVTAPEGMTISSSGLITWTPEEQGKEQVTLRVTDEQNLSTFHTWTITVQGARNEFKIMSVHLPEEALSGSVLPVSVKLENRGNIDLNNARVEIVIPELGIKRSSSRFDLEQGTAKQGTINVPLPYGLENGDYLVKITLTNGQKHEAAYRYVSLIP